MCEARGQTPSTQPPHVESLNEGDGEDALLFVDLMYEKVAIANPAMVIDGLCTLRLRCSKEFDDSVPFLAISTYRAI